VIALPNSLLFWGTVLIWGTTWYAILGQLGVVHPLVSVVWRFLLASALMFLICVWRGDSLRMTQQQHLYCGLLGISLFGLNYCLFYTASLTWTTGLISVVFSTMVFWNTLGAHWVLKRPLERRALIGGLVGVLGLGVLFRVEVSALTLSDATFIALLLCVLATLCASTGNLVSAKLQAEGSSVWVTTAYGMAYGALVVALLAVILEIPFTFEWTSSYLLSLSYLVVFGSVIAFGSYLTLLGRIGPGRVAYSTVLFPVIALLVSVWLENYEPNEDALIAIALVLFGNWIALSGPKSPKPACVKPAA
jgi:drug/metabolite transporter (DMT)-like permease